MSSSPRNRELAVTQAPLRDSERDGLSFRKTEHAVAAALVPVEAFRRSEQDSDALRESEQLAAEILDAAFIAACINNKEIADLCRVSVSLVEKWRSRDARGCPSLVQLLCLPTRFHIELHRAMNRRLGLGRAALAHALEALGALALVVEP
jgi:hypothetical protein